MSTLAESKYDLVADLNCPPERESQAWLMLAMLFEYPDAELVEALASGQLRQAILGLFGDINPTLMTGLSESAFVAEADLDSFAAEYSRLFYLGDLDIPPCPLHEGEHYGHRMEVMEKVLAFYRHFGLALATSPNEMPDHLISELEFLHFLSFQQHHYQRHQMDAGDFQRARYDFIDLHAQRWMPNLQERIGESVRFVYFRDCALLLRNFVGYSKELLSPHPANQACATTTQARKIWPIIAQSNVGVG